ncbi:hypothetical protein KKC45_01715 [Patescibacteria group bacterium]|nr:hypothetical protein [Patescibacteria group bacterium]
MVTGADNISFIPKKNTSLEVKKTGSVNFAFLVAMVIFLATIVSSLGVFLYKNFLKNKIEESSIMLEREKENFDTNSINQFSRLGERIKISEELLNNHIDLTGLFEVLEINTLKTVQFKSFDFSLKEDGLHLSMKGIARDYSTVALQSDILGDHPLIKDIVFSNLDVNDEGQVVFDFSATVDKDLVSYRKRIE